MLRQDTLQLLLAEFLIFVLTITLFEGRLPKTESSQIQIGGGFLTGHIMGVPGSAVAPGKEVLYVKGRSPTK